MKGLYYISTPHSSGHRGGGAGITAKMTRFSLVKCDIKIPHHLECVWGILKPKYASALYSQIICCSFYSPPWQRSNHTLIDHITTTLQSLLTKHPNSGILIAGDKNLISFTDLQSIDSSLKQIVTKPTREDSILDVVLTNLSVL